MFFNSVFKQFDNIFPSIWNRKFSSVHGSWKYTVLKSKILRSQTIGGLKCFKYPAIENLHFDVLKYTEICSIYYVWTTE